jgi:hypothetical protein
MAKGRDKARRRKKKMLKKGIDPNKIKLEKRDKKREKAKRAADQA